MRSLLRLAVLAGLVAGTLPAATIVYDVINLNAVNGNNQPLYRYVYNLIGVPLGLNQELEIRFEVTQYAALTNPVAPGGGLFDLLLFQPNNPIGADGRYSLLALVNNPSMVGTFSVDVAYIGNSSPGEQIFAINQLDAQGGFVSQVTSGFTQTPEPATVSLTLAGLGIAYLARRRTASPPQ
jgi:hypothetical protein